VVVPISLRALAALVVSVVMIMMLVLVVPRAHRRCAVQPLADAPLVRDNRGPHA
jgi:hypothetical protein